MSEQSQSHTIRKQLEEIFSDDTDFHAFCLDHFRVITRRYFATGMNRMQKTNCLLTYVDHEDIMKALEREKLNESPEKSFTINKRQELITSYTGLWGAKIIWLPIFTLLPVLITFKFQFIRLHSSLSTCIYIAYHILGLYIWIEVNQTLKTQDIDERKWKKIYRYARIHNVISWLVLLLLSATFLARVNVVVHREHRLSLPEFMYQLVGVQADTSPFPSSSTELRVYPEVSRSTSNLASEMIEIPAGEFMMGSDILLSEQPIKKTIVKAFSIDKTEVTVSAYRKCVIASYADANACTEPGRGDGCNWDWEARYKESRDNHPINCVTAEQAEVFCKWAGKRLPSESEWEYAARGSKNLLYPWGNHDLTTQICWKRKSPELRTCEAGSSLNDKSPFGVLDMAGNLVEWVSGNYTQCYTCPPHPRMGIVRAGHFWDDNLVYMRGAYRNRKPLHHSVEGVGFRCVK